MSLHRLPIKARIEYKLSVICHSLFSGLSPIYLSDPLSIYTPKGNLRFSSDNRILCIHKLQTKTFGHRSFSFEAPTIWNSLPTELGYTDSIHKFKSALKLNCEIFSCCDPLDYMYQCLRECTIDYLIQTTCIYICALLC